MGLCCSSPRSMMFYDSYSTSNASRDFQVENGKVLISATEVKVLNLDLSQYENKKVRLKIKKFYANGITYECNSWSLMLRNLSNSYQKIVVGPGNYTHYKAYEESSVNGYAVTQESRLNGNDIYLKDVKLICELVKS